MMRINKIHILLAAVLLVAAVSCKKEKEDFERVNITFQSTLEKPEPESEDLGDMFEQMSKNFLAMERYIYWEPTDSVAVFAGIGPDQNPADDQVHDIVVGVRSNQRYADINCNGIKYDDTYYGVFPARSRVGGNPLKINILDKYKYRDNTSFPRPGIPMVAWDGGRQSTAPVLDFHSVCGLVRIQITSDQAATVTAISFTEGGGEEFYANQGYATKPISGMFDVHDIDTYTPYVTAADKIKQTKIRFYDINQPIGPGNVLTFYLPLPATQATGIPDENDAYCLGLAVKATQGGKDVLFKQNFHVRVRRNTMSFMRTITIKDWKDGTIEKGLVGEGTEIRPFQIYNAEDMQVVRDAFMNNDPHINGIAITNNTVFRVVRANIELNTGNWTEGIHNFKGKFTYETANDQVGIINISNAPIFEEISANGLVENLTVKGSVNYSGKKDYSPFCVTNSGIINNCANICRISATNYAVAGLCVNNTATGVIKNSTNSGSISTTGHAAGICLKNRGLIKCYSVSNAIVTGHQAGGICDSNWGDIRSTQVIYSRSDVSNPYGGIAYVNMQGGLIDRCQVLGNLASTAEIGGICHTNRGTINACRNGLSLLLGSGRTGGIVAYQSTQGTPEIRNCYNSSESHSNVRGLNGVVGGIVAYLNGGKVYNCYCTNEVASGDVNMYGIIAGDVHGGDVQNCYNGSSLAQFYGQSTSHPIGINCFNPSPLANCCVYKRGNGEISTLTNGSYGSIKGQLYDALNAWVDAVADTHYFAWSTDHILPIFTSSK